MLHIGQDQLEVNGLDITRRINRTVYVHNVVVVKAAYDMDNRVYLTDVRQELIAQTLALGRAAHQTGNVHELNDRRGGLLGVVQIGQRLETVVGYGNHAHVGVDGAERIVRALRACVGDGVEQGRFADVRQAHDA